jgi:hypothetical protein
VKFQFIQRNFPSQNFAHKGRAMGLYSGKPCNYLSMKTVLRFNVFPATTDRQIQDSIIVPAKVDPEYC